MEIEPQAAVSTVPVAIRAARGKLTPLPRIEPLWPLLGAAALFAAAALSFAVAVIAGPPHFGREDLPAARPGVNTPL